MGGRIEGEKGKEMEKMRVRKWKRGEGWERARGREEGGRKRREKQKSSMLCLQLVPKHLF